MPTTDAPRRRDDLTVAEIDGETVIYDPRDATVHHLNSSATIVWSCCDGTSSVADIIDDIAQAFGLAVADIADQIHTALSAFEDSGLLAVPASVDG